MDVHVVSLSFSEKGSQKGSQERESIVFTDRAIRHLEPAEARRVVWARGLPGLGIRVSPKGKKSFIYKYGFDGRDRWLTLGEYPMLKLADAFRKYGDALEKVQSGEDPAGEQVLVNDSLRRAMTVRELASEYVERYAKTHKRTWAEDERILRRYVSPVLGTQKANRITRRQIMNLLDDIVARGAPIQANRTLAVIRKMFSFAVDRDILDVSPCQRVKPPSPETSKDRNLDLHEFRRFWLSLETAPMSREVKLALRLLALTLQRPGEIVGLRRSELDLIACSWTIPAARSKNKRAHLVPLSSRALEIIEEAMELSEGGDFLFASSGSEAHLLPAALSRAVVRSLDHLQIAKFTPHDLRRTGSTQLGAFQVPRFIRERVLNHADRTIGAVYDLYEYQDEKRAALNLWSDILEGALSGDHVDVQALRAKLRYSDYLG